MAFQQVSSRKVAFRASCSSPSPKSPGQESARRRRFVLTGGFPELPVRLQDAGADEEERLLQSQGILRSDAVERAIHKDIPQAFGVTAR